MNYEDLVGAMEDVGIVDDWQARRLLEALGRREVERYRAELRKIYDERHARPWYRRWFA